MAKTLKAPAAPAIDDSSIPYRVVIDFLEGTLRKQDAIAFARGFIEHHFDAQTDSGYYVAPYVGGYIFEVQEGGQGKAYLPGILSALEDNPQASACVQMARRVLEVKKSTAGTYTAILLPEGTEPQNPDKVFPEPGPKLIPFQRSGLAALIVGASIFGIGFLALMFCTIVYLVQVSGLLSAPLQKIDYASLPLTQWQSLMNVAGQKSNTYVKAIHLQNGHWTSTTAERIDTAPDVPIANGGGAVAPVAPPTNPLALPGLATDAAPPTPAPMTMPATNQPMATPGAAPQGASTNLPAPPVATPGGTAH